ncbi:adenylate synthase, partial [Aliarcobacter butzleri]
KEGNLHLNEDIVYIEKDWIDEKSGRFSPIITDFNRKSQPIIRYKLDDILILEKQSCPCGCVFTRIKKIEGRCDDILKMKT